MAQQVKFYSVSALPETASTTGAGGIYFVDGGELYKGSTRFGLGRVTTVADVSTLTTAARGDINIYEGTTKVFDGTNWVVAASAFTLPDFTTGDAAGQVKLGSVNASVNGWSDLVASVSANASSIAGLSTTVASLSSRVGTLETKVSGIEGIVNTTNGGTVTASSGVFTNLTVSNTATFSATTVSADTLTIGGSTVNQIAQAEIGAVTANTITATGTSLPTESAVATYVTAAVSNLAGAMHFRGTATITKSGETITVSNFSETFTPAAGDVVVDTTNNLEAVYTGSKWELLGSNSVYALDAYAPGSEVVTAGATTLGGAVHAIAGAVDTLNTKVSALESAVTGGSDNNGSAGVNVSVTTAATTAAPTVTVTVTKASLNTTLGTTNVADKTVATSIGATGVDTALATEKAVRNAITAAELVWLDASGAPLT